MPVPRILDYIDACAVAITVFSLYLLAYNRKSRSVLNKIPTIGPDGVLSSWIGSIMMLKYGHRMIQEGYQKYPNRIFKIAMGTYWLVIANGNENIEDIRKAPDSQLSVVEGVDEHLQYDYTLGPGVKDDQYHLNVLRRAMTKNIAARFDNILDGIDQTANQMLAGEHYKEWSVIPIHSLALDIVTSASTRFLVGPKISSNERYKKIIQEFNFHITRSGTTISMFPTFIKPAVSRILLNNKARVRELEGYLAPTMVKERPETDTTSDMVSWLLDSAPPERRNLRDITLRMILINMASIHTTTTLLTHVLVNLTSYPEYVEPLREEIACAIEEEGWTKAAIEKMRKLDSFVKESHRLHGSNGAVMARKVMSDTFVFRDGTVVPKGMMIAAPSRAINHDDRLYPNADKFQGFRFAEMEGEFQKMTDLSPDFMTFGLGRHACPGRFLAIINIKTIAARLLIQYDFKLYDEKEGRPKDGWFIGMEVQPNKNAKICYRPKY